MPETPEPIPPAILAFVEGKNSELKKHHLYARIGDLNGSRVQEVRRVLSQWAPKAGTPMAAMWEQVRKATELYADKIDALLDEAAGDIPGIDMDGTP